MKYIYTDCTYILKGYFSQELIKQAPGYQNSNTLWYKNTDCLARPAADCSGILNKNWHNSEFLYLNHLLTVNTAPGDGVRFPRVVNVLSTRKKCWLVTVITVVSIWSRLVGLVVGGTLPALYTRPVWPLLLSARDLCAPFPAFRLVLEPSEATVKWHLLPFGPSVYLTNRDSIHSLCQDRKIH
jgi:hypothetical protein